MLNTEVVAAAIFMASGWNSPHRAVWALLLLAGWYLRRAATVVCRSRKRPALSTPAVPFVDEGRHQAMAEYSATAEPPPQLFHFAAQSPSESFTSDSPDPHPLHFKSQKAQSAAQQDFLAAAAVIAETLARQLELQASDYEGGNNWNANGNGGTSTLNGCKGLDTEGGLSVSKVRHQDSPEENRSHLRSTRASEKGLIETSSSRSTDGYC